LGGGRLDQTWPARTTRSPLHAGVFDAEQSRQRARNGRNRTQTSPGESTDLAAGRPRRQLLDEVVLVRPLLDELDELDEVEYPISAAIWADWDCSVARVVSMAVNCASIIVW